MASGVGGCFAAGTVTEVAIQQQRINTFTASPSPAATALASSSAIAQPMIVSGYKQFEGLIPRSVYIPAASMVAGRVAFAEMEEEEQQQLRGVTPVGQAVLCGAQAVVQAGMRGGRGKKKHSKRHQGVSGELGVRLNRYFAFYMLEELCVGRMS